MTTGIVMTRQFSTWLDGMNKYMDGCSVDTCTNEDERRGWWSALWADAEEAADMRDEMPTDDELDDMYAACKDVDAAQSEQTDWRM